MPSKNEKSVAKYNLRDKKYRKKVPPPPPVMLPESSSDDETYYSDEEEDTASLEDTDNHSSNEEDDDDHDENDNGKSSPRKKFNRKDLQNMLAQMFPSKYMNSKIDKPESPHHPRRKQKDSRESTKSPTNASRRSPDARRKDVSASRHKKDKNEKSRLSDSEQSDIDIENSESDESSENDESETEHTKSSSKKGENINIIFTIGKNARKTKPSLLDGDEDEDADDLFSDDDSYEESGDDSQCNSEDEQAFMKETYEEIAQVTTDSSANVFIQEKEKEKDKANNTDVASILSKNTKPNTKIVTNTSTNRTPNKTNKEKPSNPKSGGDDSLENTEGLPEDIESEYLELLDIKKRLSTELAKHPTNKILKRSVQDCTESIRNLIKRARRINTRKYRKLLYEDTKPINEMEYFKRKLSHKEQKKAMEDLNEIYSHIYTEKPYRLSLIQSKMPSKFKAVAMQKLNVLKMMDPSDSEYYKIKNWVDTFMKIPFGVYKSVSVSIHDGVENCNRFLLNAKQTLDDCTYGLNDAKMQIMQMLGQWMVNPVSVGSAIAIHGPMGTGKTTLVKEGISKILGREFTFIALGGSGDASFLEGHSYTYEGSTWGKIVQILIDSKCMNPVIYFDELDKVSDTPRGQEIIGILTHLIDTSQNTQYHDKYFSEIDFDLSKCLFIFSYNDENLVNPILRDRMYHIRTKGYESKDKVVIARNYLLPKIREQVCFSETEVVVTDEMIQYIVSTFTKSEMGVRNLKRCLEIIYSKLNLFRLVLADNKMFTKDMNLTVSFPITLTKKEIDVFVKTDDVVSQSMLAMYV